MKASVNGSDDGRRPRANLYTIAHPGDDSEFLCGRASGGRQVFLYGTCAYPLPAAELVAIFFDPEGNLIGSGRKNVPPSEPAAGPGWREAADAATRRAVAEWQAEMGFVPGAIRVRRFSCEDVLIEDLPDEYKDFLANPLATERGDERSRADLELYVEAWLREKKFVLVFGKEYWMSAEGMIEAT
jgi:hypothetical protein